MPEAAPPDVGVAGDPPGNPHPGLVGNASVLGFDYGSKRVGVAVGNPVAGSAQALTSIVWRALDDLFSPICVLIESWQPAQLVVGRPLTEAGDVSEVTTLAERFARRLEGRFGLPVILVDERFSSVEAQHELRALATDATQPRGSRRRARLALANADDDAEAAAVILRQYFVLGGSGQ